MSFNHLMNIFELQIGNPHFAWLAVLALLALVGSAWAGVLRRRALTTFGTTGHKDGFQSVFAGVVSALALAMGIVFLSLALMDVRWGKTTYEVPQKGLEVVFALDVSRSMLAQDASPNRLERAKQQIKDMVDEMAGDRVGLVVFAGEADQAVPLTSHYDDFKQILDSVGPHSISVGGSQLGVALKTAAEAFISKTNEHKTIILFTDGEDQESEPVKLAKKLHADEGIRVFTIGLGDFEQGARIPDEQSQVQSFVQHDGQQVWSKLNGRILKEIATETEGAYIPAGTKRVNMADVYHGYVAKVEQTEFETAKINAYVPRFQWFAGAALLCLLVEVWLSNGRKRKPVAKINRSIGGSTNVTGQKITPPFASLPATQTAAAIVFLLLVPTNAFAQDADSTASKINAANELVRQQKTTEAIDAYNQIDSIEESGAQDQLDYNLAVAHYRNSDYAAAITLFGESSKSLDRKIAASSRHNLGNCHYAQALPLVESQPDAAIEELQQSIVHYRSALRLDRSNADSRSNIELARRLIKQIQDRQKQEDEKEEQQQQEQQDKNSEPEQKDSEQKESEQNEQNSQEQQESQENSGDSQGSKNSEGSDPQDSQSQQQEPSKETGDQSKSSQGENDSTESQPSDADSQPKPESTGESGDESEQTRESGNEEIGNQAGDQSNQPQRRQSDPTKMDKLEDGKHADAADKQPDDQSKQPAAEQMAGQLTSDNQSKQQEGDKSLARTNQNGSGLMTREEALKMLQSVRDRDMLRRIENQRRQRIRRVPVEKDW